MEPVLMDSWMLRSELRGGVIGLSELIAERQIGSDDNVEAVRYSMSGHRTI